MNVKGLETQLAKSRNLRRSNLPMWSLNWYPHRDYIFVKPETASVTWVAPRNKFGRGDAPYKCPCMRIAVTILLVAGYSQQNNKKKIDSSHPQDHIHGLHRNQTQVINPDGALVLALGLSSAVGG